ncbi:MAG: hypothetical protein PHR28_12980 [candidate division Zixibacteria bacterium]|jgi:hypothetical protein|nr:hypothetical protein [candidate division Zixibacteria bacterium]
MINQREIDTALNLYAKNRAYIDDLDELDLAAYRAWGGRDEDRENASSQQLHANVRRDVEKIDATLEALKLINTAYRQGDQKTKRYIERQVARQSPYTYDPENGPVSEFFRQEVGRLRDAKRLLTDLLRDADVYRVPPIPRKTAGMTVPTSRVTGRAFGETLIKNAKKIGGFKF